jgi:hypothetical protein
VELNVLEFSLLVAGASLVVREAGGRPWPQNVLLVSGDTPLSPSPGLQSHLPTSLTLMKSIAAR